VYRTYKVGPRTLPSGTPAFIGCSSVFISHPYLELSVRMQKLRRDAKLQRTVILLFFFYLSL
jgi:hypothetical protein